ncbi:AMP-binding protein [Streptomyces noursei]|uniref:AMP-binding protein n=1 Tax=Streptomyces noursei TaxID=1971 RepID=UPI0016759894|nr:AMP-binding protein [Streptomyces noursei]MCZ1014096.1 AMP-binding protein [Streptomyces noursei]GGX50643.1 D-alanine--poly(phosphoribitol) ligase subunit 1 [Streptomyces noursei]
MPSESAVPAAGHDAAGSGVATSLLAAFTEHAERIAVEVPAAKVKLSYRQLHQEAQNWAKKLGPPSAPLVLYVNKGADYYRLLSCAFLYGYSLCPVDRANPLMSLKRIVEQFDRPCLVTDDIATAEHFEAVGVATLRLSGTGYSFEERGRPAPRSVEPRYFISTSGSTGVPRLVEVRHDATSAFVAWSTRFYQCKPGSRWAQFTSIGFDLSLVDFLTVLCSGGTLVALTTAWERLHPGAFVAEHAITHWHSVPTMIPHLLRGGADLSSVQCFTFCGEPLLCISCVQLRERAPDARIVNTYGPTEGTLFCSFHEVSDTDMNSTSPVVPIGAPIPGWSFAFIPAESHYRLVILSEHLAEGYLNQESENFSTVSIAGQSLRSFDTGDYFSLAEGAVRFSHRKDGLIKVHGNRVDVGEVADACMACGVQQPVLILINKELVLFFEDPECSIDRQDLLRRLLQRLPSYAVPSKFTAMMEMPRTANGKIDRNTLAERLDIYE